MIVSEDDVVTWIAERHGRDAAGGYDRAMAEEVLDDLGLCGFLVPPEHAIGFARLVREHGAVRPTR